VLRVDASLWVHGTGLRIPILGFVIEGGGLSVEGWKERVLH